jgi:AcrR family transcriptional regulator
MNRPTRPDQRQRNMGTSGKGSTGKGPLRVLSDRPSSSARQLAANQTRLDILAVATTEFADKGLAGARVDEIARQTATSKHMIYYYFGGKEQLYHAVLERAYANFNVAEAGIDYARLHPVDALTSLVGLSFDFHVKHPSFVRILMSENINSGQHLHHVGSIAHRRRQVLERLDGIIRRGVSTGQFRKGLDALHLHMTISALCFYYVSNRFTFGHIFCVDLESQQFMKARRAVVVDALLRICRSTHSAGKSP